MAGKHILAATLTLLTVGLGVSAVFSLPQAVAKNGPAKPDFGEINGYKKWTRVNPTPLKLPVPLDGLCRVATLTESVKTSANPHRQKFFTVFANRAARHAMMEETKPIFPVGSIITKEKMLSREATTPELITVMVKREKGFNPEGGDWEYAVRDGKDGKLQERGKLNNCVSCHALKKSTDYVFRSYLTDETRRKQK
jgi:hypothetical protein